MEGVKLKPQYLRIKNWEKFQHYKGRRPPWVKFHVELLDDYELMHLAISSQLVYDRLLLLAARLENLIPNDPKYVASLIHLPCRVVSSSIVDLIDSGFLEVACNQPASNGLAEVYARDRDRDRDRDTRALEEVKSKIEHSLRSVG